MPGVGHLHIAEKMRKLKRLISCALCLLACAQMSDALGQKSHRRAGRDEVLTKATQEFVRLILQHRDECYWQSKSGVSRSEDRFGVTYRMVWRPYGDIVVEFEKSRYARAFLIVPFDGRERAMAEAAGTMLGGRVEVGRYRNGALQWYLSSPAADGVGVNLLASDELYYPFDKGKAKASTTFGIIQQTSKFIE
jgi:hypothetical protein